MNDVKLSKMTSEERLEQLDSWFRTSSDWDNEWRENSKLWTEFYIGNQWTPDEATALTERGQAVTTYNHIAPAIDAIVGGERQNRPEIKMTGRTPDDERIAQVKTELYNYITYNSSSDDEEDKMLLDMLICGRGWMSVYPNTIKDKFDDILHAYVDYRDMFVDPYSKRDDLKDARYVTQAVFTDEDIIKSSFPKFVGGNTVRSDINYEGSSDDGIYWSDADRTRPRLLNTWFRDEVGDIHVSVWVYGQELYYKKTPYSENTQLPFVMATAKRDLDNFPYGLVKGMVSAQEEVNKRHSKALHYLSAKQVLAEEDAFVDWNEAKKTLAKPDGITKLSDGALSNGKVMMVDNIALASTHIQMMELAKGQVMTLAGINPSMLGQAGQYESGAKTKANIAGATNTLVPLFNKFRSARQRVAYITMQLVPDFYTDERLIRILAPNGSYAFMAVNAPQMLDDGVIELMNDLTTNDVDVVIEDAPASLNERTEQFNQLLIIQGQTGQPIDMDILLRYSNLKDKHILSEEIGQRSKEKESLEQAGQYIQQLEQQVQQLGGQVNQVTSQLVQSNVAREVDSEVAKVKSDIQKEKQAITKEIAKQ